MLAQRAGVGVGLGAAHGLAVVGFGRRVNLRVLFPVAAVGKSSLAKLTLEWLLTCNTDNSFTLQHSVAIACKVLGRCGVYLQEILKSFGEIRSEIVHFGLHCVVSADLNASHLLVGMIGSLL